MNTSKQTVIVKIGTNLLTDHHQRLDLNNMRHIVYQMADLYHQDADLEFIVVSSGAITSGAKHMNIRPTQLAEKQAAASIGQILLFQKYYEFFQAKHICVGQLLVTKDNFEDIEKKDNIIQTIHTLLAHHTIPIINENDSVSTDEIQFGDNDQLSAILATHVHATQLIILTNEDGVLDQDGMVIPHLSHITATELALVQDCLSSPHSKGGMTSKLMAAKLALDHGIRTTIANGRTENILHDSLYGQCVGTTIH